MTLKRVKLKEKNKNNEPKITNIALRNAEQPVYITFNFSFLTTNSSYNMTNKDLTNEHQQHFINRIIELSNKEIVSLTARTDKKWGLEKISKTSFGRQDKIKNMSIHDKFDSSVRKELSGDNFWIFRLCPNNNPYETRIIGKMIDDIFYVMFFDINHDLYAKRK